MAIKTAGVEVLKASDKWQQHIDIPAFNAPWLIRGGDWQTLYNRVFKTTNLDAEIYDEVLFISLGDDGDDETMAFVNHPDDGPDNRIADHPYIVLFHGLGGGGDSVYMRQTAEAMTSVGYSVIRVNMRGSDEVAGMADGFYHAGKTDDMRHILKNLSTIVDDFDRRGFILGGYSLGANQTIKYLAEEDCHPALRFAFAISPPVDLAATQSRLMAPRNKFYQRYLVDKLRNMLAKAIEHNSDFPFTHLKDYAFKSVLDFDELVVAPMYGFRDAADYYRQCSSAQFLPHVKKPLLLIHAASDPWIPNEPLFKIAANASDMCCILSTVDGGHVGFHVQKSSATWFDKLLMVSAEKITKKICC